MHKKWLQSNYCWGWRCGTFTRYDRSENACASAGRASKSSMLSGIDSLYSIVQMPKGIPVGTLAIGPAGAANAGLLAAQILAGWDAELLSRLQSFRESQTRAVLDNPDPRT